MEGYYHCPVLGSVLIHPQIEVGCIARVTFEMLPSPSLGKEIGFIVMMNGLKLHSE